MRCARTFVGKLARWMFGSVVSGFLVGSSINSSSSSSCRSSISSSSIAGRMVVWSGMACGGTLGSWGLPVVLSMVMALTWVVLWLAVSALSVNVCLLQCGCRVLCFKELLFSVVVV